MQTATQPRNTHFPLCFFSVLHRGARKSQEKAENLETGGESEYNFLCAIFFLKIKAAGVLLEKLTAVLLQMH